MDDPESKMVINPNGGLDVLISHFHQIKIFETINTWTGKRHNRAEYTYGQAIETWIINLLAGSNRLEQSLYNKNNLEAHPKFKKGMSPDTISRTLRDLSVENTYYTKLENNKDKKKVNKIVSNPEKNEKIKLHEVNLNPKLNAILLDTAIELGLLKVENEYELDIDATILPNKVSDARAHYKKNGTGYCPMVVLFGGLPIYIEMRNGNSNPIFRKLDVLKSAIDLIQSRGLNIKFVRIDAAGSSQKIIDYLSDNGHTFYIRANQNKRKDIANEVSWRQSEKRAGFMLATNYHETETHNFLIVDYLDSNQMDENGQPRIFGIITNDFNIDDEDIVTTYNQRGAMEHRFSDLKSIGWHYMVHREMKFNAVHVHMTMLAYLFFIYSKKWLASKVEFVPETIKPKTFIKKFIQVITMWVEDELKFLNRQKEYESLFRSG